MNEKAVLAAWQTQLQAMDEADTFTLAKLFTSDAVLVHMTGHRQRVSDWLAGVKAREFVYHELVDKGIRSLRVDDEYAQLVGRVITGVTHDGSGQAWHLEIAQDYQFVDDQWLCTASRVTTWCSWLAG